MPQPFDISPVAPQLAQDVPPFLQGMHYSQDRARFEEQGRLQDVLARRRMEEEQARAPIERRGLEATTRKQELGTQLEEVLQPGKERLGLGEQQLASGQQQIAQAIQILAKTPPGPDFQARLAENLTGAGIDVSQLKLDPNADPQTNALIQQIARSNNPREMQQLANQFLQQQSEVAPAYRQAMDVGAQTGEYSLERQRIANEGAIRAARVNAQGKVKSAVEYLQEAKGPVEIVTRAAALHEMPGVNPALKQWAAQLIEKNWEPYQIELRKSQIQIQHPMLTPTPLQQPFTQQEPQSGAQQYVPGKEYTGKTGTYRYKGGDPTKRESWERVK